ncbi:MAG: hypothetical protein M3Q99_14855 [Acidobacteriota bacterium]|nr:hypothetical protein [Acidobacteriota bacterium]
MVNKLPKYFFTLVFVFAAAIGINAQSDASTPSGRAPVKDDLPKNIQETLDKHKIEQAKKDHEEMIERGEEALKLSEELEKSVANNDKLSPQDQTKLARLEKITKKIRKELGGDDDDGAVIEDNTEGSVEVAEVVEKPSVLAISIKKLQSTATKLLNELKKTSRFSVSVIAIQSSNSLLKILKFIKVGK